MLSAQERLRKPKQREENVNGLSGLRSDSNFRHSNLSLLLPPASRPAHRLLRSMATRALNMSGCSLLDQSTALAPAPVGPPINSVVGLVEGPVPSMWESVSPDREAVFAASQDRLRLDHKRACCLAEP